MRSADHIPFLYGKRDCDIFNAWYSDSVAVRLSLDTIQRTHPLVPSGPLRWIDPAVDGIERWGRPRSLTDEYKQHLRKFPGFQDMGDEGFQQRPQKPVVEKFTLAVLDECNRFGPDWLSIPLLPLSSRVNRRKLTKLICEAAASWKETRHFRGKLILPAIVTGINQIKLKAQRSKRVQLLQAAFVLAGAEGIWVVDSSLRDQEGARPLESVRFPKLIEFHREMVVGLPDGVISIGGPYWGMNLILWAKGLVRYPAVNVGKSYQYHLAGARLQRGSQRVALPPLKRWAVANPQLRGWLARALEEIPPSEGAHTELFEILQDFARLRRDAQPQVAAFYKGWFERIAAVPAPGRALALFQDFSAAYALGKGLPDMPAKGPGRQAAQVAKQFMVNCL